jgi:hypothetical protein
MLYPVWFFIAAVFSYLALVHWRYSTDTIRPFKIREREDDAGGSQSPASDEVIHSFVKDFNMYLQAMNKKNTEQNRAAMVGYFGAAVIAIISLFMTLAS